MRENNIHYFDSDLAEKVGVNAALLMTHLQFWLAKQDEVYFSVSDLREKFPYMSKSAIGTAIDKLVCGKYITKETKGIGNRQHFGLSKIGKALPKIGKRFTENRKPITDIDSDIRTDNKKTKAKKDDAEFEKWWTEYPRKVSKGSAKKSYYKALENNPDITPQILLDKMCAYAKVQTDEKYIKHPATWLNQECWNDELPEEKREVFFI